MIGTNGIEVVFVEGGRLGISAGSKDLLGLSEVLAHC